MVTASRAGDPHEQRPPGGMGRCITRTEGNEAQAGRSCPGPRLGLIFIWREDFEGVEASVARWGLSVIFLRCGRGKESEREEGGGELGESPARDVKRGSFKLGEREMKGERERAGGESGVSSALGDCDENQWGHQRTSENPLGEGQTHVLGKLQAGAQLPHLHRAWTVGSREEP